MLLKISIFTNEERVAVNNPFPAVRTSPKVYEAFLYVPSSYF